MTIAVYRGRKATKQPQQQLKCMNFQVPYRTWTHATPLLQHLIYKISPLYKMVDEFEMQLYVYEPEILPCSEHTVCSRIMPRRGGEIRITFEKAGKI